MDPRRLGAAQEGTEVARVLDRVEGEQERRLGPLDAARERVVQRRPPTRADDERYPLVPVETREGGEAPTLDLHDRDARPRGMQHECFEGRAAVRHDEEPADRALGAEGLLDRSATGNQLLALVERDRGRVCEDELLVVACRCRDLVVTRQLSVAREPLVAPTLLLPRSTIGPLPIRPFVGRSAPRSVRALVGRSVARPIARRTFLPRATIRAPASLATLPGGALPTLGTTLPRAASRALAGRTATGLGRPLRLSVASACPASVTWLPIAPALPAAGGRCRPASPTLSTVLGRPLSVAPVTPRSAIRPSLLRRPLPAIA